jgi:D-alanyl-D-alanine dipeptidase
MGIPFDFFGLESWTEYKDASPKQRAKRLLLRTLMIKNGLKPNLIAK